MILFGVCAGPTDKFDLICRPALERYAEECDIIVLRDQAALAVAYNTILDAASERQDVEGVVLLHDDVELADEAWREKLARAFDAGGDVVGVIGGWGRGGMAWWSRENVVGRVVGPAGNLDVVGPGYILDVGTGQTQVEVLDGLLLAISPWGVSNLRFEIGTYPGFHGYDADICAQAHARGRKVLVAPIDVVHHTAGAFGTKKSYDDWIRAVMVWKIRWKESSRTEKTIHRIRIALLPLEVRIRPAVVRRRRTLRG